MSRVPLILACALLLAAAAPAVAEASWGAIAVDRSSGNSAGVSGYATAGAAREAARSQCQGSCRILVTVRNACGVVIEARGDYFAGRGSSVRRATRRAARRARTRSYSRVASVCSN